MHVHLFHELSWGNPLVIYLPNLTLSLTILIVLNPVEVKVR